MTVAIGVMGSAGDAPHAGGKDALAEKAKALATALAVRNVFLLTGATTGIVYLVGKAAHDGGIFHVGISPAVDSQEHERKYKLPIDACQECHAD